MNHETFDSIVQIIAIVVPLFMAIITGLLAYAVQQTIGRVNDKVESVQYELGQHKKDCERVDKGILMNDVERLEDEVTKLRSFAHWASACLHVLAGGLVSGSKDVKLPERSQ